MTRDKVLYGAPHRTRDVSYSFLGKGGGAIGERLLLEKMGCLF